MAGCRGDISAFNKPSSVIALTNTKEKKSLKTGEITLVCIFSKLLLGQF